MCEEEVIEKAIRTVMEQLNISEKTATCEFLVFMVSYGTVDDFKDAVNYYIKNQDRLQERLK